MPWPPATHLGLPTATAQVTACRRVPAPAPGPEPAPARAETVVARVCVRLHVPGTPRELLGWPRTRARTGTEHPRGMLLLRLLRLLRPLHRRLLGHGVGTRYRPAGCDGWRLVRCGRPKAALPVVVLPEAFLTGNVAPQPADLCVQGAGRGSLHRVSSASSTCSRSLGAHLHSSSCRATNWPPSCIPRAHLRHQCPRVVVQQGKGLPQGRGRRRGPAALLVPCVSSAGRRRGGGGGRPLPQVRAATSLWSIVATPPLAATPTVCHCADEEGGAGERPAPAPRTALPQWQGTGRGH